MPHARSLLGLALLLTACAPAGDVAPSDAGPPPVDDPAVIPEGWPKASCDGLVASGCALPWPSSLYLAPDATSPSGYDLAFAEDSLPATRSGVSLDPALFDGLDGYGLGVPILFDVGPVDLGPLPDEWDGLEASTSWDSPSLLLQVTAEGLQPVPHFVERDVEARSGDTWLYLRPAVILDPATRYVVALRGLTTPEGAPVPATAGFAALRDRTPTDDPGLAARRDRFEGLFTLLDEAGVRRDELVLAWDFVTGSEARLHGRLDSALDAALTAAPDGAVLDLDDDIDTYVPSEADVPEGEDTPVNPWIRHHLHGTLTTPAVVDPAEPGGVFTLNVTDDGTVEARGDYTAPILVQVPHAAVDGGEPVGVMIYGHGMFGNQWEVVLDHLEFFAHTQRYVMIGVPLTGMSGPDGENMTDAIGDLNQITLLTDGLHQGLVDHHLVARAVTSGHLAEVLAELDPDIAIDDTEVHYFGASQGGIFGATLLATSPSIRRGVLAVPGLNYSTLLSRSINFEPFLAVLQAVYSTPAEVATILASVQLLWDRTDPVSYHHRLLDPASERDALYLVSKGDKQVAVLTNEIAARTFPERLPLLGTYDTERTPWGTAQAAYPHTGSGIVLFDFGNPWPTADGNAPPSDDLPDPHSRIAEVEAAGDLMSTFLRTGEIIDICGGDGCTPE